MPKKRLRDGWGNDKVKREWKYHCSCLFHLSSRGSVSNGTDINEQTTKGQRELWSERKLPRRSLIKRVSPVFFSWWLLSHGSFSAHILFLINWIYTYSFYTPNSQIFYPLLLIIMCLMQHSLISKCP